MRKSRKEKADTRQRIIEAAAKLYREKGFDGVGVAQIMEAAGLTHGGFYRHFPSRDALIAEAMSEAFQALAPSTPTSTSAAQLDVLRRYIEMHLSQEHLDNPSYGCPVAAVGSEVGHIGGDVSAVFNNGMKTIIDRVTIALGQERESRAEALRLLTSLVGAVVIARAAGTRSSLTTELIDTVKNSDQFAKFLNTKY